MKKILSIALLLFPLLLHAQRTWQPQKGQNTKKTQNAKPAWRPKHNVTKFLGIPVDGSKWTMIQKLKEKGFVTVKNYDRIVLEGEFNGEEVYLLFITNNNKVWRISVADKKNRSEVQIKARYNQLIQQFRNNKKYKEVKAEEISENQDFSFDTDVANYKYKASFRQAPWDLEMPMRSVWFQIFKQAYGQYGIGICYDNLFNDANGEDL